MSKAANGRSSIHRDKTGAGWHGWVTMGAHPATGKPVRKHVRGRTKTEVAAKVEALERQRDGGVVPIGRDTTLSQWLDTWVEMRKAGGGSLPGAAGGRVNWNLHTAWGAMASPGTTITAWMACYACASMTPATEQVAFLKKDVLLDGTWVLHYAAVNPLLATGQMHFYILTGTAAQSNTASTHQIPNVRCDRVSYIPQTTAGGCVFPEFTPTLILSSTDPTYYLGARTVRDGQQKLAMHWGWAGHGAPLTRQANDVIIGKARAISCRGFVKANATDSCDEYAFASTFQSSYYQGRAGVYVAHVPISHNTKVGSLLSGFFVRQRILQSDPFWVSVV